MPVGNINLHVLSGYVMATCAYKNDLPQLMHHTSNPYCEELVKSLEDISEMLESRVCQNIALQTKTRDRVQLLLIQPPVQNIKTIQFDHCITIIFLSHIPFN